MINEGSIADTLQARGLMVVGFVVRDGFEANKYLAFIGIEKDGQNKQIPSNKKLNTIKSELSLTGQDVEFILVNALSRDLESAVRATMLHTFGSFVRNAFLSIDAAGAHVWLVPKKLIEPDVRQKIHEKLSVLIAGFDLAFGTLQLTNDENTPSKYACLTTLRTIAPADAASLQTALQSRGFSVPSTTWIVHRLDALRKAHQVIRMKNGNYAVSLETIRALGTKKNRKSPDISRLLALARQPR